jgi:ElaB/YqjD/DUF883 family membrane-anchored ribosome-binding protein
MSSTTRSGPGAVTGGIPADLAQRNPEPNARAKSADTIPDLGSAAKQAADTLVSATTEKLKDAANQQVAAGADLVRHVGASVRAAGEHLEGDAPQLARLVFNAAETIERSADRLRGQSAEEFARSTAEFARERPEIVFGVAAVGGFLLFRLLNAGISGATGPSYRSGGRRPASSDPSRASNPSFSPA